MEDLRSLSLTPLTFGPCEVPVMRSNHSSHIIFVFKCEYHLSGTPRVPKVRGVRDLKSFKNLPLKSEKSLFIAFLYYNFINSAGSADPADPMLARSLVITNQNKSKRIKISNNRQGIGWTRSFLAWYDNFLSWYFYSCLFLQCLIFFAYCF